MIKFDLNLNPPNKSLDFSSINGLEWLRRFMAKTIPLKSDSKHSLPLSNQNTESFKRPASVNTEGS